MAEGIIIVRLRLNKEREICGIKWMRGKINFASIVQRIKYFFSVSWFYTLLRSNKYYFPWMKKKPNECFRPLYIGIYSFFLQVPDICSRIFCWFSKIYWDNTIRRKREPRYYFVYIFYGIFFSMENHLPNAKRRHSSSAGSNWLNIFFYGIMDQRDDKKKQKWEKIKIRMVKWWL